MVQRRGERERDVLAREPSAGAQVVKTITRKIRMLFLLFVRTIMVGCGVACRWGGEVLRI